MPSRNGGPALDLSLSRSTFSKALLNATGNTPHATEADVESRLEREILTATVRANATRADEETRFKQLHRQLPSAGMITELERAHRVRVAPEITRLVRNIIAARRELVLATLGFRGFVQREEPQRMPRYPRRRFVKVAVIAAVTIAIDGGIGVRLVAEHLNGGYGGAVAYSLGVAVVTGSLAVLAGETTRQFYSKSLWKKLVAGVVLIGATTLTLLIGLEYAQLRDAILHGHSIDGVLSGLGAVLRHPHLTGGGWLLALLTLSTAGALGHAVFESDDPIPGYGRVHRVWLAAQAALERRDHELAALRGAAADALQQSLRLVVERAEAILEELEAIAARHTAATEQGALELAHLQRQAESELKARSALESIDGSRIQRTQFPTRAIVGSDLGSLTLGALRAIESCRLKIRESLEDFLAWFDRHVASEAERLSRLTQGGDGK